MITLSNENVTTVKSLSADLRAIARELPRSWIKRSDTIDCWEISDHLWWFKFWIEECPMASLEEAARIYRMKAFI